MCVMMGVEMPVARDPVYHLELPRQRDTALIFASPHSGRAYPRAFLAQSDLDERTIRSSEDAFVDQLYAAAPRFGAPHLSRWHRGPLSTSIAPRTNLTRP